MSLISQRLQYFDSSAFRNAIKKQSEIVDPIDLSIGIPEELTPEHIKAAGIRAIETDKTVYTPSAGIPELREAVAKKLDKENHLIGITADTVTIVPGLTTGLLLVYLAILDPGDEIIIFDPYYPPYPHLASVIGAHVVYVSALPDFQPDLHALEVAITNRTKVIVVNSPNNPSGAVYPELTLRKIAQIAKENDLLVISDEIYEHFTYDIPHFSIGSIYPNTITMNGFSKEFAMTGWRLGYIAGPSEVINAINELQQYVVFSSSSIAQYAGLAAMKHRPRIGLKYHQKRDLAIKSLREMGYNIYGADGAYYLFIETPHGLTDVEFAELAGKHGLIIVPGRAFSRMTNFVRISYGADIDTLARGLAVLKEIS
jgi:aspartate aminotransferase